MISGGGGGSLSSQFSLQLWKGGMNNYEDESGVKVSDNACPH